MSDPDRHNVMWWRLTWISTWDVRFNETHKFNNLLLFFLSDSSHHNNCELTSQSSSSSIVFDSIGFMSFRVSKMWRSSNMKLRSRHHHVMLTNHKSQHRESIIKCSIHYFRSMTCPTSCLLCKTRWYVEKYCFDPISSILTHAFVFWREMWSSRRWWFFIQNIEK